MTPITTCQYLLAHAQISVAIQRWRTVQIWFQIRKLQCHKTIYNRFPANAEDQLAMSDNQSNGSRNNSLTQFMVNIVTSLINIPRRVIITEDSNTQFTQFKDTYKDENHAI